MPERPGVSLEKVALLMDTGRWVGKVEGCGIDRERAMDQDTQVQPIRTGPASVVKGHVPKVLRRPSMEWP